MVARKFHKSKSLTCTNSPKTCNDYDRCSLQLYSNDQILHAHKDVDCTLVVLVLTMVQVFRSNQLLSKILLGKSEV